MLKVNGGNALYTHRFLMKRNRHLSTSFKSLYYLLIDLKAFSSMSSIA